MIFVPTENIQGVVSDIAPQNPGFYDFQEILLHNYRNEEVTIPPNSKLGILRIECFSEKSVFIPQKVDQTKFENMAKFFELREDLSEKIDKMLENASPLMHKNQINQENSHESLEQKQLN